MKTNKPNTIESLVLFSGHYDWRKDFRLNLWLLLASFSYGAGHSWLRGNPDAYLYLRLAVALFPLLPLVRYVQSWMLFVRSLDELQRRMQLEVWLFAALGTLVIGAIIAVLNANGVPMGLFSNGLGIASAFFIMIGLWTLGSIIAIRRYK